MAWKGKLLNLVYQVDAGSAHGVWPILAQIVDSAMLHADLSYLISILDVSDATRNVEVERLTERGI